MYSFKIYNQETLALERFQLIAGDFKWPQYQVVVTRNYWWKNLQRIIILSHISNNQIQNGIAPSVLLEHLR